MRHQTVADTGMTPYLLWRDDRPAFEDYQAVQTLGNRAKLSAPYWACFVCPPGETLFVGVYRAERKGFGDQDRTDPLTGRTERELGTGEVDAYDLAPAPTLSDYIGRLTIDWGLGTRSWIQRGDGTPKPVAELRREFRDPAYPGHSELLLKLTDVPGLPASWREVLRSARGVYLLTCPRTKEQYVGSACGTGGFLSRWSDYAANGHGGNVALKSREPSEYQISILEVSASTATEGDVLAAEGRWKRKLQSREMGLNRN